MMPCKVLVVRFSSIGDIVLTTPVLRCLGTQMPPGTEVHFLTKKAYAGLLTNNPYVAKVFTIERSTNEIIAELKNEHYDYVLDLHHNLRSAFLKRKLGILSFSFPKLNFRKWLWVNTGIGRMPNIHIVDRYMAVLKPFGLEVDDLGLEYYIPEEDEVDLGSTPLAPDAFIAVAIGAQHVRKKLPVDRLIDLCKRLSASVVLLGGAEDADAARHIASEAGQHVWAAAGRYNLHQSASILKQSSLVISHDTGLMHIAAAFKKPIVSIWGATVPEFGMYPYRTNRASVMVAAKHLQRRPCTKLGTSCKYATCRCVNEISLDEVVMAVDKIMPSIQ